VVAHAAAAAVGLVAGDGIRVELGIGGRSSRILFQSASSSSAMIIGVAVIAPWPISGTEFVIVTMPSRSMRSH